jgi:DNA-binding MarR family transcriptional regulator
MKNCNSINSPFDLKYQNGNTDAKIVAALERIAQVFRVLLWNESKKFSLSPIQVQVLIFLLYHSDEKRKISYLAKEFNITKATLSETIKILEQKKLIQKEYEPHDSRSYIIHLTAKGKSIAERTSLFAKEISYPIEKLLSKEKENLLLSLLGIIRHLNQVGIITTQRMCFTCCYYQTRNKGRQHFCKLLNQKLAYSELRIDCQEHEPAVIQ